MLDLIEEGRDLTIQDWNFRQILQQHLQDLLHKQKIYWKQRGDIKWAKIGDAPTKFYHARATINHRRNAIKVLTHNAGQSFADHKDKENLLWVANKERLGTSENTLCSLI